MIYEETDDLIGLGDFAATVAKARKGARKFRSFVKRTARKIKAARGKGAEAAARVASAASPQQVEIVETSPGAGAGEWVKKNMLLLAGGGLVALLLVTRKARR